MDKIYTISEIRRAGKIGEISDIDVEHLISLLDEDVRFEEGRVNKLDLKYMSRQLDVALSNITDEDIEKYFPSTKSDVFNLDVAGKD